MKSRSNASSTAAGRVSCRDQDMRPRPRWSQGPAVLRTRKARILGADEHAAASRPARPPRHAGDPWPQRSCQRAPPRQPDGPGEPPVLPVQVRVLRRSGVRAVPLEPRARRVRHAQPVSWLVDFTYGAAAGFNTKGVPESQRTTPLIRQYVGSVPQSEFVVRSATEQNIRDYVNRVGRDHQLYGRTLPPEAGPDTVATFSHPRARARALRRRVHRWWQESGRGLQALGGGHRPRDR